MIEGTSTAALLLIGNELLSGRTQDANMAFLAARLAEIGIPLIEARVVPDVTGIIAEAVNALRPRVTYLFTTGGIGPTHDDITAASIAQAFGVPHVLDERAAAILREHYPPGELNAARLRMATLPQGAELIENPVSKAPGFRIGNVYVMAGIPKVMQAMFESLKPGLKGGAPILSESVTVYLPESKVAAGLAALQERYPGLELGSYPFQMQNRSGTRLVVRGTDPKALSDCRAAIVAMVEGLGVEGLGSESARSDRR
ncbi:MAG: competence/damage-inducible protein A [Rhodospirillales bacterium]|nr:competence/damage-inducible protein A [Rhodospirillales bacterium]